MLDKKHRLTKELDIQKVFANKKSIFGKYIIINFSKNDQLESRFAFVVSNKTFKKAVDRNYYKRILRSIVRELLPTIEKNFDFVIVIKDGIKLIKFPEIKQDCINLFNKIK
jgi:ribonuclease P protein component